MLNNIVLSGMAWASSLKDAIATRISEERGQDLIEYAVLAGAIALVGAALLLGLPIKDKLKSFTDKLGACLSFDSAKCI